MADVTRMSAMKKANERQSIIQEADEGTGTLESERDDINRSPIGKYGVPNSYSQQKRS